MVRILQLKKTPHRLRIKGSTVYAVGQVPEEGTVPQDGG
jgi:hypothetical protein